MIPFLVVLVLLTTAGLLSLGYWRRMDRDRRIREYGDMQRPFLG